MFYFIFYSLNSALLVFSFGFGLIFLIESFSSRVARYLRPVISNWNVVCHRVQFSGQSVLSVYESLGKYF